MNFGDLDFGDLDCGFRLGSCRFYIFVYFGDPKLIKRSLKSPLRVILIFTKVEPRSLYKMGPKMCANIEVPAMNEVL